MNKHKLIKELTKQTKEVVQLLPAKDADPNDGYLQLLVALINIRNNPTTTPQTEKKIVGYKTYLNSIPFSDFKSVFHHSITSFGTNL